jgi:hypothetical protein
MKNAIHCGWRFLLNIRYSLADSTNRFVRGSAAGSEVGSRRVILASNRFPPGNLMIIESP